ncbi:hypothetical protein C0993_001425 [Termitomyces sp. T159_Od127]|nr:hypothetical protein C0993_001425 [Termitomyces sp. T159_Od127]
MEICQPLFAASRLKTGPPNLPWRVVVSEDVEFNHFAYVAIWTYLLTVKHDPQDPLIKHLESEDQRMNEMILQRAQGRPTKFVSLANDSASQNLLASMRQESERLRRARTPQQLADAPSPDVRRLNEVVEDLRRENEVYRSLARQTPRPPQSIDNAEAQRLRDEVDNLRRENERLQTQLITSSLPPPEYAPPPYVRSD